MAQQHIRPLQPLGYNSRQDQFIRACRFWWCARGHPFEREYADTRCHCGAAPLSHVYNRLMALCGRQSGKGLDLATAIPTPNGWRTMADLSVGDTVFDESGQPTQVTFVTEPYIPERCYRIILSDGTEVVADGDHQWVVHDKTYRKALGRRKNPASSRATAFPRTITTDQMVAEGVEYGSRRRRGTTFESRFAIPLTRPVQYPHLSLPIDPYTLGAWLGDGASAIAMITCADQDDQIVSEIWNAGYPINPYKRGVGRAPNYGIGNLTTQLRALNEIGNKHIPDLYLRASPAQRLALLQGLMDTDGTIDEKKAVAEFTNTNFALSTGVKELAESLGMKAVWTQKDATLNGRRIGDAYRVTFFPHLPVFRLERKQARQRPPKRPETRYRYIRQILPIPVRPVKCIQVEATSEQYLCTESYLPTHNTRGAAMALINECAIPNTVAWVITPTYRHLHDYSWPTILSLLPKGWLKNPGKALHEGFQEIPLVNGSLIQGRSAEDPEDLRGQFGVRIGWFDEAALTSRKAWTVFSPALGTSNGIAIFTTTPAGYDWTYDLVEEPAKAKTPGYYFTTWPSSMNPGMPAAEIEQARLENDADEFAQEWEATRLQHKGSIYGQAYKPYVIDDLNPSPEELALLKRLIPTWDPNVATDVNLAATEFGTTVGVDPGAGGLHPYAAAYAMATHHGYVWYGEYWEKRRQSNEFHAAAMKRLVLGTGPVNWTIDMRRKQDLYELSRYGVFCRQVGKDVESSIRLVKGHTEHGRFFYLKSRVPRLLYEKQRYRWADPPKRVDESVGQRAKVVKKDDDVVDGERYATEGLPDLPPLPVQPTGRDLEREPVPPECYEAWKREMIADGYLKIPERLSPDHLQLVDIEDETDPLGDFNQIY